MVWVDLCAPFKDELVELAEELDLHELAIEDVLGPHQRPKVDRYETHLFVSTRALRLNPDVARLEQVEVDAFVGQQWLVTVRDNDAFSVEAVVSRWDRSPDLAVHGVSYLLYGLLDVIVDGYFEVVQQFDDYYDRVSEALFSERPLAPSRQRHWFEMRQTLTQFRRIVEPMREVVSGLTRRYHETVSDDLYPYYQDIYDHAVRIVEATDALRDLVSTIVETSLSLRDYHNNQIMKQVTSWAAIIAVPTLITGWYGMNVPYPGSQKVWGAILAAVLILLLSGGLYLLFKRKDWI